VALVLMQVPLSWRECTLFAGAAFSKTGLWTGQNKYLGYVVHHVLRRRFIACFDVKPIFDGHCCDMLDSAHFQRVWMLEKSTRIFQPVINVRVNHKA
jgi:hypothetical protein